MSTFRAPGAFTSESKLDVDNAASATLLYIGGFGGRGSPAVVNGLVYAGYITGFAAFDAAGRKNCVRADLSCDPLMPFNCDEFTVEYS